MINAKNLLLPCAYCISALENRLIKTQYLQTMDSHVMQPCEAPRNFFPVIIE